MTRGRCDRLCLSTWGSCIPSSKPVYPGAPNVDFGFDAFLRNTIGSSGAITEYAMEIEKRTH
jgi:hypothetical protein